MRLAGAYTLVCISITKQSSRLNDTTSRERIASLATLVRSTCSALAWSHSPQQGRLLNQLRQLYSKSMIILYLYTAMSSSRLANRMQTHRPIPNTDPMINAGLVKRKITPKRHFKQLCRNIDLYTFIMRSLLVGSHERVAFLGSHRILRSPVASSVSILHSCSLIQPRADRRYWSRKKTYSVNNDGGENSSSDGSEVFGFRVVCRSGKLLMATAVQSG